MPDVLPQVKFEIFSGMLRVANESGVERIRTTASSSVVDHAGHEITKRAIDQMAASAIGKTIFLNHSYHVPEDVYGVVTDAKAVQRSEIWDLDLDVEVEVDNPRAVATTKSVKRGVKLGTSIGVLVKDAWKNEQGHLVIDDVELLEASIVGIPSNPRSWVQYAVKSYEESGVSFDEIVETRTEPEVVLASEDSLDDGSSSNDVAPDPDPTLDASPEPETLDAVVPPAAQEGQPTDPESATNADGATPDATKDTEPKEAIPVSSLEVGDPVGDAAKALLSVKQADFSMMLKMIETTTHEMVEAKKALFLAQSSIVVLEKERDEAKANVALAKQFVDRLSELPIGRRASHSAVIQDFHQKFSGIYDPDFLKMLTTGEDHG